MKMCIREGIGYSDVRYAFGSREGIRHKGVFKRGYKDV